MVHMTETTQDDDDGAPDHRQSTDPGDVRMRGFMRRTSVDAALTWIDHHATQLAPEPVDLSEASGRVLTEAIASQVDVPGFARAMMDGFALRAEDTYSAQRHNPVTLRIVAQILPGMMPDRPLLPGEAARIMTGAPVPVGASCVLPIERVATQGDKLQVFEQFPAGKHIGLPGEDIARGHVVVPAGRRLRPQDLGVLSSIGVARLPVVRKPRVRIVITGNELLPSGTPPRDYRIVDANGPMLAALVERDGGVVTDHGILPDTEVDILRALNDAVDVVLVSGGSSVGIEDFAPRLLAQHGQLAIHGVAMRPGSPSGMGLLGTRRVFLLPGNPVSCLCSYDFFAGRAIRLLGGRCSSWPYATRRLPFAQALASQTNRVDYARVRVTDGQIEPLAISGSSLLSSTTQADGFVIVPADCPGYSAGEDATVYLYDDAIS